MKLYYVSEDYIDYLRTIDKSVMENKGGKRPYVGVVLTIQGIPYYAPLSSPKKKHQKMKNSIDFRKIKGGKYGVINFNNMIPVCPSALTNIVFDNIEDTKYRRLLQNQLKSINEESDTIKKTANKLHSVVLTEDDKLSSHSLLVKKRCCKLSLLEDAYKSWLESHKSKKTEEEPQEQSTIKSEEALERESR